MNLFLKLFVLLLILPLAIKAETFSFSKDFEGWGSWGDGLSSIDSSIGHSQKGSVLISTDWGESQTIHYRWNKLRPGLYKISAHVRAENVQSHPDKRSFWHFYDIGNDTQDVFSDLVGSYDWRKIEYTINVPKGDLSIWFRLKSPGKVWIDDFSITSVTVANSRVFIAAPTPLPKSAIPYAPIRKVKAETILLDFETNSGRHPFEVATNISKQKMGKFFSQQYYNFDVTHFLSGNWSGYDRIQMDVYNGGNDFQEFYLTLGDNQSHNYWSQLNHKTHLAPGWNHLDFSLTQFLGERGSHKFMRSLDLTQLKKWFLIIDPNKKFKTSSAFFIDNIKLSYSPPPIPPKEVRAFDFTSHKDFASSGFKKVSSQDLYDSSRGFGFVNPRFWRIEDSRWVGVPFQYSIGVLSGHFKVKLPNGKYELSLVIDRLGYWDVSFWKDRTLYINGHPVFKESRPYGRDYLKDFLQFEMIVPKAGDHPYELYLKKIFTPLVLSFEVTNGELDLEFEGDATGISLNSLVIWNVNDRKKGQEFIESCQQRLQLEFDWMSRAIVPKIPSKLPSSDVSIIEPSLTLRPEAIEPKAREKMVFRGGVGEEPYQLIQVRGDGRAKFSISDFVNKAGNKILSTQLKVSEVIPQYISPDLNHETYMIAGKYLKELSGNSFSLEKGVTKYVWIQLKIEQAINPGVYSGTFSLINGALKKHFPIEIQIHSYKLPKLDFPVGFFGPDPIGQTYFQGNGLDGLRNDFRLKALKILGGSGFTTFSGIPPVKIIKNGSNWSLDTSEIDTVTTVADNAGMSKVYFSYGGSFPQQLFDGTQIPYGMSEEQFFTKISPILQGYLKREGVSKIVHTFTDEAAGYSDRIKEDTDLAKKIKRFFPFLLRGGFGTKENPASAELNTYLDYGFFSNVTKDQARKMGRKISWGSYNSSPGNLDDPRYTFGPGLYFAREMGLKYYLEWHSSAVHNYPYYDLDGRESDVTMFMPSSNGELYKTLRYELAVEGLRSFKKLKLLESNITRSHGSSKDAAKQWLSLIKNGVLSDDEYVLRPSANFNFRKFEAELDMYLDSTNAP